MCASIIPNGWIKNCAKVSAIHFEAALHALNEQAPTDLRVNTLKDHARSIARRIAKRKVSNASHVNFRR